MLTHLRTWGWLFNPITVYWCFEPDGVTPDVVVLEVTNTPWKERDWYVVPAEQVVGRGAVFPKTLHVSPFLDQALDYRFSFDAPGLGGRGGAEVAASTCASRSCVGDARCSTPTCG